MADPPNRGLLVSVRLAAEGSGRSLGRGPVVASPASIPPDYNVL